MEAAPGTLGHRGAVECARVREYPSAQVTYGIVLSLAALTIDALTPLEEWHYHIGEIKVPAPLPLFHLARSPLPLGA